MITREWMDFHKHDLQKQLEVEGVVDEEAREALMVSAICCGPITFYAKSGKYRLKWSYNHGRYKEYSLYSHGR